MEVRFRDSDLDRLEVDPKYDGGFPREVVRAFRKRMQAIRDAVSVQDLRVFKSWRYEKLKGARAHQWSIRLNSQWRLIVEIDTSHPTTVMVIVAIEDYH